MFNDDFVVTQADLDALGQRVGALQAHIMQFVSRRLPALSLTAPIAFLDMNALKKGTDLLLKHELLKDERRHSKHILPLRALTSLVYPVTDVQPLFPTVVQLLQ